MKDDRMKVVLESIARRSVPDNVNLWPRIAEKVERKTFMQTVRARPALALVIVLLALALLSSAAYAIGKATGYIPGVGIVDQSIPLRILMEPVSTEREGITVTVNQVVADSNRTFVKYVVDGIPIRADQPSICYTVPRLQLPNGSSLELISGESGGFGGEVGTFVRFETTVSSAPIPVDVDRVTFFLSCVLPEGSGPEDWRIPLDLVRAPDAYTTPAVELDATFVASGPEFSTVPTPALETVLTPAPSVSPLSPSMPDDSGLYLDKVIELPNSYILVGNFTDMGDLPGGLVINLDPHADLPHIEDASGRPVDFKVRDDIQPATTWADRYWVRNWAYEIPKSVQGPLTITLDEINIGVSNEAQFKFDASSTPQVRQKWNLNLPVRLGTYEYVMDSVEMLEGGYLFKYHSGLDVPAGASLLFNILGASPEKNASTLIAGGARVDYSENITFQTPPTGPLTVELSLDESIPLEGPWTLTWTPPGK